MITYTFTLTQLETVIVLQALRYMQQFDDTEVSRLDKREAELIRESMKAIITGEEEQWKHQSTT
jgi:hypothetical protein